ncbi:MAG TPA: hypothetical protein PLD47_01625, partial [Aggregatilineales bacterium]|nr:hypothetical protein [Aggregatilineales bacterium]
MPTHTILASPSDAELSAAVEENLYDLFRAMAVNLPEGQLDESEVLCRHFSAPTNPMFKGVWGTRLNADQADRAIDETIAWFKARNAPFFFWWTSSLTTPGDLGLRLTGRGLLSMEAQMEALAPGIKSTSLGAPGMAADLRQMNEDALTQVPSGFVIEEVQDETALYAFKKVFLESYEIPEWAGQAWVDATLHIGIGRTPWRIFIGKLDGKPVASNILFNGAGVAAVYGVGTIAEARGKGIGGAIT